MRKEADLDISDRIEVVYEADGLAAETVANFSDYIAGETLAVSLVNGATQNEPLRETTKLGDNEVTIAIRKLND